jgi:2-amino-4-hydroxy-6-hydroxymethyldihydropteridine diphosphokinase
LAEKVAFVGLGTNLGDRQENICRALVGMAAHPGIAVERVSSLYETLPWGGVEQGSFLNAVAQLRTRLTPEELLTVLLALEDAMGRIRQEKWGPRVIDLDLLIYGNAKMQTETLQVPHPLITERAFVLVPLAELALPVPFQGGLKTHCLRAVPPSQTESPTYGNVS